MENIVLAIHLVIVTVMIIVILIQRTSSDGLSGLSGGGSAGGNALFSVRGKANILTRITSFLALGFLITSLTLAYMASHKGASSSIVDKIAAEKPAATTGEAGKTAAPAAPAKAEEPAQPEVPLAR